VANERIVIADLAADFDAVPADLVRAATPVDLARVLTIGKPSSLCATSSRRRRAHRPGRGARSAV